MAEQKITVEMKDLGTKLAQIFMDAAKKNSEYLVQELNWLPLQAQRYVPGEYFMSGLQVQTGQLVGSAAPASERIIPLQQRGDEMIVGLRNPTVYAAAHEMGFDGIVEVKPHTRAGHSVRGHSRHMHLKERGWTRRALKHAFDDFVIKIMGEGGIGL